MQLRKSYLIRYVYLEVLKKATVRLAMGESKGKVQILPKRKDPLKGSKSIQEETHASQFPASAPGLLDLMMKWVKQSSGDKGQSLLLAFGKQECFPFEVVTEDSMCSIIIKCMKYLKLKYIEKYNEYIELK